MIQMVQGDLIKAFELDEVTHIAHQCNLVTLNLNLQGIAGSLDKKFNISKDIKSDIKDLSKLGQYSITNVNNKIIFNCYSQYYTGSPNFSNDKFSDRIQWLKNALKNIVADYCANKDVVLGLPLIASGLAKQNNKKGMADIDYFVEYIYSEIEQIIKLVPVKIYYL